MAEDAPPKIAAAARGKKEDVSCPRDAATVEGAQRLEFPFPGRPYAIQEQFMEELYHTLERGGLGVFESPTGTGKSLSLICGALKWLKDFEAKELEEAVSTAPAGCDTHEKKKDSGGSSMPSWVSEQVAEIAAATQTAAVKEQRDKMKARLEKIKEARVALAQPRFVKKSKADDSKGAAARAGDEESLSDSELLPGDFHSDEERDKESDDEAQKEEKDIHVTKILYCSRTHSQIGQFVSQLQSSPYADVRAVLLASRASMCVNEEVRALGSLGRINDKCLDLQDKKSKGGGCAYHKQASVGLLSDNVLSTVQDLEQLVDRGKAAIACPYYATRRAIPMAQLVLMPYNILLHKGTREAVGLRVEGNIVIVDEAHNLLETIAGIHSQTLGLAALRQARLQVAQYLDRYKSRLHPRNQRYINQIIFLIDALLARLADKQTTMCAVGAFLMQCRIDNINLFKLSTYFEQSEIAKKVLGFANKYAAAAQGGVADHRDDEQSSHVSTLSAIHSFLTTLTNPDSDGRIVVQPQCAENPDEPKIKYVLLNPGLHFASIMASARAVIVAGGTMAPVSDLLSQLLVGPTRPKITLFSCGHIVAKENILPFVLTAGPAGRAFNFSFQHRDNPELLAELGRAFINVCAVVPDGVVAFFPSYDYEERVWSTWEKTGVLESLKARKHVVREPRKQSGVEKTLRDYARLVEDRSSGKTGALLLSVVGGKLSEGINFKDHLGRCVLMVGLPYANVKSPELVEKMKYLASAAPPAQTFRCHQGPAMIELATQQGDAGQAYYENLCMKAVNQSIGRAIRHQHDYAAIVLLDERFTQARIASRLPDWIKGSMVPPPAFGPAIGMMARFFRDRAARPPLAP
eukprot:m.245302 g.245302  ORF g.245302 m.245302 type:complete len:861 (-) comp36257_c0_seq1:26-2608(-)